MHVVRYKHVCVCANEPAVYYRKIAVETAQLVLDGVVNVDFLLFWPKNAVKVRWRTGCLAGSAAR